MNMRVVAVEESAHVTYWKVLLPLQLLCCFTCNTSCPGWTLRPTAVVVARKSFVAFQLITGAALNGCNVASR